MLCKKRLEHVTILILIDWPLQCVWCIILTVAYTSHNPYFNRLTFAISNGTLLLILSVRHNPYFNRLTFAIVEGGDYKNTYEESQSLF